LAPVQNSRQNCRVCGNKMPTRCNRGFYCRSYCLLNMFWASLCPSSGAQEYYTVVTACGISCCKNVKNNFVIFCGICVLSLKCRVLSTFVTRCVECRGGRVRPPRHSTHLVTNLDNTGHLRLRTQIPQKITKLFFTFLQHEIPQAATTV